MVVSTLHSHIEIFSHIFNVRLLTEIRFYGNVSRVIKIKQSRKYKYIFLTSMKIKECDS